tara:strand:- start:1289 stop:2290 length:1002 start_codon:yes stop_codon:yes gene_type:complete
MLAVVDQVLLFNESVSVPYALWVDLFSLHLPLKLSFLLPLALFFSIARTMYQLGRSQEWLIINSWVSTRSVLLSTVTGYAVAISLLSVLLSCWIVPKLISQSEHVLQRWQEPSMLANGLLNNTMTQLNDQQSSWYMAGQGGVDNQLGDFRSFKLDRLGYDIVTTDVLRYNSETKRFNLLNGRRSWGDVEHRIINTVYFASADMPIELIDFPTAIGSLVKESSLDTWTLYQVVSSNHNLADAKILFLRLSQPLLSISFTVFFMISLQALHGLGVITLVKRSVLFFLGSLILVVVVRNAIGKGFFTIDSGLWIYLAMLCLMMLLCQSMKSNGERQ